MKIRLVILYELMATWDRCRNSWICLNNQLLRTHTVPVKWVIVEVKGMQQQQHMTIEKIIVGKVLLKGTNFCGGNADMGDLSTTCFFFYCNCKWLLSRRGWDRKNDTWDNSICKSISMLYRDIGWDQVEVLCLLNSWGLEGRIVGWIQEFCIW